MAQDEPELVEESKATPRTSQWLSFVTLGSDIGRNTAADANVASGVTQTSPETASKRRNPPQVADLRHATDEPRRCGFPRRRAVRVRSSVLANGRRCDKVVRRSLIARVRLKPDTTYDFLAGLKACPIAAAGLKARATG